ncbi:hypothetical protein [Flavobacterium tructae]
MTEPKALFSSSEGTAQIVATDFNPLNEKGRQRWNSIGMVYIIR